MHCHLRPAVNCDAIAKLKCFGASNLSCKQTDKPNAVSFRFIVERHVNAAYLEGVRWTGMEQNSEGG